MKESLASWPVLNWSRMIFVLEHPSEVDYERLRPLICVRRKAHVSCRCPVLPAGPFVRRLYSVRFQRQLIVFALA